MNTEPTGRLIVTPAGRTLELSRTLQAPIDEVWAALTESKRTGRWIGTWSGEAGPGRTVDFIMTAEGVAEPSPVTITACEPPHFLALDMRSPGGTWRVRVELIEEEGVTTALFNHDLGEEDDVSDIGPGWEYYFDRLIAAETGGGMPDWETYYSALKPWYANVAPDVS